jgi:hypothetical protein
MATTSYSPSPAPWRANARLTGHSRRRRVECCIVINMVGSASEGRTVAQDAENLDNDGPTEQPDWLPGIFEDHNLVGPEDAGLREMARRSRQNGHP